MRIARRHPRLLATLTLSLAACALGACMRGGLRGDESGRDDEPAPLLQPLAVTAPVVTSPFCTEGWRALDETTCLALPDQLARPTSLVIHAHGALAPDLNPGDEQSALLSAARSRGVAVLFTRGKQGLCKWEPKVKDYYCWPTTQRDVDELGPEIYAAWNDAQGRAEDAAGTRFERRYLFGFSNGGYFTAFTSAEGRFPIDGAGVVGAGRTEVDESLLTGERRPIYIAVGGEEEPSTQRDGHNLSQALVSHGWNVKYVVHPGRAHELREDDLLAAWSAWDR